MLQICVKNFISTTTGGVFASLSFIGIELISRKNSLKTCLISGHKAHHIPPDTIKQIGNRKLAKYFSYRFGYMPQ